MSHLVIKSKVHYATGDRDLQISPVPCAFLVSPCVNCITRFYYKFCEKNIGEWTCENVLNHYKENDSQLTLKQALDSINKDLKRISKYGSDAKCREKAEFIIVNWKVCLWGKKQ